MDKTYFMFRITHNENPVHRNVSNQNKSGIVVLLDAHWTFKVLLMNVQISYVTLGYCKLR